MNRRRFLLYGASLGGVFLAGCSSPETENQEEAAENDPDNPGYVEDDVNSSVGEY